MVKAGRMPFDWKLALRATAVWAALYCAAAVAVYALASRELERGTGRQLLALTRLMARQVSALDAAGGDDGAPAPRLEALAGRGMVRNVAVLDARGTVLADATGEAAGGAADAAGGAADAATLAALAAGGEVATPVSRDGFGLYRQAAFVPLARGRILMVDAHPAQMAVLARFRSVFTLFGLLGLAVTSAAGFALANRMLAPVRRALDRVHAVAEGRWLGGDAGPGPEGAQGDELDRLEYDVWVMERQTRRREDELARLRREAEGRAEEMRQVASGIAHEVRNPLAAIGGNAEWLERKAADPETAATAKKIVGQVRSLAATVTRFLEYGRGFKPQPQALDLGALLDALADDLRPQAGAQGVAVERAGAAPRVAADPQLTGALLLNLARNALQAMPGGGRLGLELAAEAAPGGGWAVVRVTDTGAGIEPRHLPRLFTPFFTTRSGGTGLGLALARRMAEAQGGTLTAANRQTGGAAFTLRLPMTEEP